MTTFFCTLNDVRAAVDTHPEFTGNDAIMQHYIAQATAQIRTYTRRQWDYGEYTDYVNTADIDTAIRRGKASFVVSLREKPVSIEPGKFPKLRYSVSGRWDDTTDFDTSLYQLEVRTNQVVLYPGVMQYHPRALRIVYWAGYVTQAVAFPDDEDADANVLVVPDNIKMACIEQASYHVRKYLNNVAGTNRTSGQEKIAAYGALNAAGLTRDALSLLRYEGRIFVGS